MLISRIKVCKTVSHLSFGVFCCCGEATPTLEEGAGFLLIPQSISIVH